MKEKISALLDAEATGAERREVLRALAAERDLRQIWERYHLVGAVLRNEVSMTVTPRFADRVAVRIAQEATIIAPRWLARSVAKGAMGLALAASVAAIAVFSLDMGPAPAPGESAVAWTPDNQGPQDDFLRAEMTPIPQPEWDNKLNVLLVEHNAFSPASGMNGMMSSVRLAGYGTAKNDLP
jgi:sigma-E factor negative regulatory protein RseA